MPEIIYGSVNNSYQDVYNHNGDPSIKWSERFPESDALVFKMNYAYNEMQICKISRHRIDRRPSSFYHYFYETVDWDFFRDSFSAVFRLPFVDEEDVRSLASDHDITKVRERGIVDSLKEIGSELKPSGVLPEAQLKEILHAVFVMLDSPGKGYVELGIPYVAFDGNMEYRPYARFCQEFGKKWREVLSEIYAYLPYLLRRRVGFTVNARYSYSDKEIRVFPKDPAECPVVRVLNPPAEDADCMKLVNYLVQAEDAETLGQKLDTFKKNVEDLTQGKSKDRIQPSSYIRLLDEMARLDGMGGVDLLSELYRQTHSNSDKAYLIRLTQYIRDKLSYDDVDDFIEYTLRKAFDKILPYISYLMDVVRQPFPEYRIPYAIILSVVDECATERIFTEEATAEEAAAECARVQELVDKGISEENCLSLYECVKILLQSRLDDFAAPRREAEKASALRKITERGVPWDGLEEWLKDWGGENAAPEIREAKGHRLLECLPEMTITPVDAKDIFSRCEGCVDEKTNALLGRLFAFILSPQTDLITDLLGIEGDTDARGLNQSGPAQYLVSVLASRYHADAVISCFGRKYGSQNGKIYDLFHLDITDDYTVKSIYVQTLLRSFKQADKLSFRIMRGELPKYRLFFRNVCHSDEAIRSLPVSIQLVTSNATEEISFKRLADAFDVFSLILDTGHKQYQPESVSYLLDPTNRVLIDFMAENSLLTHRHFKLMAEKASIRNNENVYRAFLFLTCQQYSEELAYPLLLETVQKEMLTGEDIDRFFSRSKFTPSDLLVRLVQEQDAAVRMHAEEAQTPSASEEVPSVGSAGSDDSSEIASEDGYSFGLGAGSDDNLQLPYGGEDADGFIEETDRRKSDDPVDLIPYALSAVMLLLGVAGLILAFSWKASVLLLFYVSAMVSSLLFGASVALLIDNFTRQSSRKSGRPNRSNGLSLGCGAVLAVIIFLLVIWMGAGSDTGRQPVTSQDQASVSSQMPASSKKTEKDKTKSTESRSNVESAADDKYKPRFGHSLVGKCVISTEIDHVTYYLACDKDNKAYLTEKREDAVLYKESDDNDNLYFVFLNDSTPLSLCFKGNEPKKDEATEIRFSKIRDKDKRKTYQWIFDDDHSWITYSNGQKYSIYADKEKVVLMNHQDEYFKGTWEITDVK